jgi:SAM-dependent methyltransferase
MNEPPDNKPIALDAYEAFAERYAAQIESRPYNAYCERPAILSLVPEVTGWRVLDAGCGTGLNTEWLLQRGAEVVGVDVSPAMLRFGQERVGGRCVLHQADLRLPLDFLDGASFDLVFSSLVLHYIEDWRVPFAEFNRVLRPGGLFVFSIQHPCADLDRFGSTNYYATELLEAPWRWGGDPVIMPFYRRPLGAIMAPLREAGFVIEHMIDAQPTEDFKTAAPDNYARWSTTPTFLGIRARRTQA